ncbi:glycosyltransferase family 9 protein [Luteolibacter sp. LG18]|uniref:glycosyltransferase family 9 protein n=1 Tax=Luteolibacter sp. LG18 TaxID=2819286 RepID=UPI002B29CB78|nr:lipopolysaccharide heptosyltransferase II [Luteolibacter sp. LG18]
MSDAGQGMLVTAPERWDEACFAVPALRALAASGLPVSVLCPAAQETFWQTLPGLSVLPYPAKASANTVASSLSGKFAAALIWEPGVAADACAKAGIPRRTGPGGDKALSKRLTDPLPLPTPGPIEHRVRHYLAPIEAMGIETRVAAYFEPIDQLAPPAPGTALLVPDSDFGRSHEWPLDRWETVARALLETGTRLTLAGIPGGGGLAAKLAKTLGDSVRTTDLFPSGEVLPLLAAHERVIAADGSLPHLAAHAGATCIVLFGPNEPAWKRPLGKRHTVLRRHVECSPCFAPKCALDLRCQHELEMEKVLAAVK